MASYVGLDPAEDIAWVTGNGAKPMDLYVDGKSDAFLGGPLEAPVAAGAGHRRA